MKAWFDIEIWKPIKDYEGLYEVSNFGRIRSLDRTVYYNDGRVRVFPGSIKKLKINKQTHYPMVELCKNSIQKTYAVHRLVADAFIYNPNKYPVINHKDESRDNNYVYNLEWCTQLYNSNYGTIKTKQRNAKLGLYNNKNSKPVCQIDIQTGEIIKVYPSAAEVTRINGWNSSHISDCCKGKRQKTNGYKWQYYD